MGEAAPPLDHVLVHDGVIAHELGCLDDLWVSTLLHPLHLHFEELDSTLWGEKARARGGAYALRDWELHSRAHANRTLWHVC